MLAKVYTCAVIGLDAQIVEVEVDTGRGLPAFFLVGLPDAAVKESSERIRSAIKNSGLRMHGGRITVNLAPADLRKAGPSYDLPIAIGILAATDQIPDVDLDQALFVGELGLDGAGAPCARRAARGSLCGEPRLSPHLRAPGGCA